MRVLIIEDELLMSRSIEIILGSAGFEFNTAATGADGIELARTHDFGVILLDLTLPDSHGFNVLQRLRTASIGTPVIILTGTSEVNAIVQSFGLGADDYVTKPFERTELLARVQAVVRRSKLPPNSVIVTGDLSIDLAARIVEVAGRRVQLTGKEYLILEMLALRKGKTLTKEMLVAHLYGGRDEPELKIIDVFICKIRKKLAGTGAPRSNIIETIWGRGYTLRDPEVEDARQAS